jgi:hypothetical protein
MPFTSPLNRQSGLPKESEHSFVIRLAISASQQCTDAAISKASVGLRQFDDALLEFIILWPFAAHVMQHCSG